MADKNTISTISTESSLSVFGLFFASRVWNRPGGIALCSTPLTLESVSSVSASRRCGQAAVTGVEMHTRV